MTDKHGPTSVARLESPSRVGAIDPLAKNPFLNQLRLEKRRVDRSKAPLSMVLYRYDGKKDAVLRDVRTLLKLLRSNKRETDILGQLDSGVIAILLLDTNQDGMRKFMQKIVVQGGNLPFLSVARRTPIIFSKACSGEPSSRRSSIRSSSTMPRARMRSDCSSKEFRHHRQAS